uniref:Uncharacterized protein n=1 Tax=Oryza meridionalis TaxID=40149 RepID=A0A0E0DD88_9ORYZ
MVKRGGAHWRRRERQHGGDHDSSDEATATAMRPSSRNAPTNRRHWYWRVWTRCRQDSLSPHRAA